ncbi:MAG: hypothetical protein IIA09_15085 [Proteobacteria bacterium]|nr:hypothetical protein [Pseudomonadota bacterium]
MLGEFLNLSESPNDDLLDLIELAFLDGAIDGITAALALSWVEAHEDEIH